MDRLQILNTILQNKVAVVVRGVKKENTVKLVNALYDGGIRVVEIPFGFFDDEYTFYAIKEVVRSFGDKMIIGAGTVKNMRQLKLAVKAGVKFAVSPFLNGKIIKKTIKSNIVSFGGAFTPTEIMKACEYKVDIVKIFPANTALHIVKALKGPFDNVKMFAFGGITEDNVNEFLKEGASGVGIGGYLADNTLIEKGDFATIKNRAQKIVSLVK